MKNREIIATAQFNNGIFLELEISLSSEINTMVFCNGVNPSCYYAYIYYNGEIEKSMSFNGDFSFLLSDCIGFFNNYCYEIAYHFTTPYKRVNYEIKAISGNGKKAVKYYYDSKIEKTKEEIEYRKKEIEILKEKKRNAIK